MFKEESLMSNGARTVQASSSQQATSTDLNKLAARLTDSLDQTRLQGLSQQLGVRDVSLRAVEVGWDKKRAAFTFPERDAAGRIIGISTRKGDGSKSFMKGGKRGLTMPQGLSERVSPILVVEGPTDVAACHTLGLSAIGRPSNSGGIEYLAELLVDHEVLIVGENDRKPDGRWPGREGAEAVARRLASRWTRPVSYALPPDGSKDIRSWLTARQLDLNDEHALRQEGLELLERLKRGATTETPKPCAPPYYATADGITYDKSTKDGSVQIPLTNFTARILSDVFRDDGIEQQLLSEIETTLNGQRKCFKVPASRFSGMAWVMENLGAKAVIYAGFSVKEHARLAIQLLSSDIVRLTIYTHTGWRRIDGQQMYLHGNGAVSSDGQVTSIDTDLPDSLRHFALPAPPTDAELRNAIRASLDLLPLAPDRLTVPLLGAIYRSVLRRCDFALHLVGKTGTFKTELAALAQRHFGAGFDARSLPGSWSSTGNSVEALAFVAKDTLLVVDDFAPGGTPQDVARYHRDGGRVIRAQGNQSGRGRCRTDGTLRPTRSPRGLILSTGEDVPRGQSVQARLLVLEIGEGDVKVEVLTQMQGLAADGIFAAAMAGYLQWLASRRDLILEEVPRRLAEYRHRAMRSGAHRRTPDIIANLAAGWEMFLRYAVESGAIDSRRASDLRDRVWLALGKAATVQTAFVAAVDPVHRFRELLSSAISSGRAHLTAADGAAPEDDRAAMCGWRSEGREAGSDAGQVWKPQGDRIGWIDGEDMYLDAAAAYRAAQSMAGGAGEAIPVGESILWRHLRDRGLLLGCENDRKTFKVRRTHLNARPSVLWLRASSLFGEHHPTNPTTEDQKPRISAENRDSGSGPWSGGDEIGGQTRPRNPTTIVQNNAVGVVAADRGRVGRVPDHIGEEPTLANTSEDREVEIL